MSPGLRRLALAGCLPFLAAPSTSAQAWEVAGLAGFTPAVSLEHKAPALSDLRIRGAFTWGVDATRFLTPRWGAEVMFTRQGSALQADTAGRTADVYRITLAQLHANVVYQFGDRGARWKPFVFGGAGATFFAAPDLPSSTKAALGLGGGLKYFPRTALGLRGQLRYKPTWLNDDLDDGVCEPFGFCQGSLQPIEITGGVIVRF